MKMKKVFPLLCLAIFFITAISVYGQGQEGTSNSIGDHEGGFDVKFWVQVLIGAAGIFLAVYLYVRGQKDKEDKIVRELETKLENESKLWVETERKAEEDYRSALGVELGTLYIPGLPDIDSKIVSLAETFVSLRISESSRLEEHLGTGNREKIDKNILYLSPEEVMKRALTKYRVLLFLGEAGSGKTTLLKYYALNCLDRAGKKYLQLGYTNEILPFYLPLRELEFRKEDDRPVSLQENLAHWADNRHLNISTEQFYNWLRKRKTLVLLDGLDEISSKKRRRQVSRWIKNICAAFSNACFVVTSRAAAFRKPEDIELEVAHTRADILGFSPQQQEDFLKKWFRAVHLAGLPPKGITKQWKQQQEERAAQQAQELSEFLNRATNKALQELAAVPLLLQIMAVIWNDRQKLPKNRMTLFDTVLNYLLEYHENDMEPMLPAAEARRVLTPAALWMQEELKKDEIPKNDMHRLMQEVLDTMEGQPGPLTFCQYLRDRVGLIVEHDSQHYTFRHKCFREFLAAEQSIKDSHYPKRIKLLVEYFKEDWWEETLRFFMGMADDTIFDRFMGFFFQSGVSRELSAYHQAFLQDLISEAPGKRIDALVESLNSGILNNNQERYVLDCLKTIGTPVALEAIEEANKNKWNENSRAYAADIIAEADTVATTVPEYLLENDKPGPRFNRLSSRNPLEGNVEYIKITGGTCRYSLSQKMETVTDIYFCKYPVTNKRYRKFISFLEGKEESPGKGVSFDVFVSKLWEFAAAIKGYAKFLGEDPEKWHNICRSPFDDEKKFKGDDQPVVGIDWFAARSYCFWLSCMEAGQTQGNGLEAEDANGLAAIYRLPREIEWEWAAGGQADGSVRQYPWAEDKGNPALQLANYGNHVGAPTPVGRFPEGKTPTGLMDVAGNVWEWTNDYYDADKTWFALRGGSWRLSEQYLQCTSRINPAFRSDDIGFRVVVQPQW